MDRAVLPAAIVAERQRQIDSEGYTQKHDDAHGNGEMLAAARMYWQLAIGVVLPMRSAKVRQYSARPRRDQINSEVVDVNVPIGWPWAAWWWKPKTPARDLERAGALCLAEIDRLARRGESSRAAEETLGLIVSAYEAQS